MYTEEQKGVLNLLRSFLIEHNVLKEYCSALNHPKIYHGSYTRKLARGMLDMFSWSSAIGVHGVNFGKFTGAWYKHLPDTKHKFEITFTADRANLISYLLKSDRNKEAIRLAKSKFIGQL